MRRSVSYLGAVLLGLGIGFGLALAFFFADHPSVIVEERWRTVTTAPPVTYLPETPFHMDPAVVCDPYVPPTTRAPRPAPTSPTATVVTAPILPSSTTTTVPTSPSMTAPVTTAATVSDH